MNIKQEVGNVKAFIGERRFVKLTYSSEDAFKRFEAVKQANDILHNAVCETGGDMPEKLLNYYEELNTLMDTIKREELDVISVGR